MSSVILNEETKVVPIGSVQPHPRNVNRGDVSAIQESITHNGFFGSLIVQRSTGHILAGTHRWMAASQSGYAELPVTYVDVDDATALRIMLADNRTARLGGDDPSDLAALLQEIIEGEGGLLGTAYSQNDLDALLAELSEESRDDAGPEFDRLDELLEKWGVESGQVWRIPSLTAPGKAHRLMCGDSTSASDVERLLAGAAPRLLVTDPPYGVEYDPSWRASAGINKNRAKMGKVANDDRADWRDAWELSPAEVAYVWHGGLHASTVQASLEAAGFEVRSQIIWIKDRLVLGRGAYHWRHEPAWYAVRRGKSAGFIGGRKQTTEWGAAGSPSMDYLLELWDVFRSASSVWEIPAREDGGHGHGTQKPVECMARPIRNHGGDVHEPFSGSGTTFVAAEHSRRVCYGMEFDPGYVAVILERLAVLGLSPHRAIHDEEV